MGINILIFTIWLISIGSVFGNPLSETEKNELDYCEVGLNDISDSNAYYTIEHFSKIDANDTKYDFENHLKYNDIAEKFTNIFGEDFTDVLNNLEWYFSFETVRRTHYNNVLLESLHCIFLTDRDTKVIYQETKEDTDIENFAQSKLLNHLKSEVPSHAPMPRIDLGSSIYRMDSTFNFGRALHNGQEYYFGVFFYHLDRAKLTSVKITEKNSSLSIYEKFTELLGKLGLH